MKKYIRSEWMKHRRTFVMKLLILAPVITLLMNVFAPMWYQQNSFNWWYILPYFALYNMRAAGRGKDEIQKPYSSFHKA